VIASLAMYPFAHLRTAYDQLWSAVSSTLEGAPETLDRDIDLHVAWGSPDLLVGQTCGWPLITALPDVAVIGAFDLHVPFAHDGRYRSVIIGDRAEAPAALLSRPGAVAAANGWESLSGWISLCSVLGRTPVDAVCTGSHAESVRAVAEGRAQVASIDALTFEFIAHSMPAVAGRVHIVGHGPIVPTLPLVMSAELAERRDEVRTAFVGALARPDITEACARLRIRGFVPFERSDYEPLAALAPQPAS
jgi:ABC-type phosphate/phosphonate transport system substrate-binding protein